VTGYLSVLGGFAAENPVQSPLAPEHSTGPRTPINQTGICLIGARRRSAPHYQGRRARGGQLPDKKLPLTQELRQPLISPGDYQLQNQKNVRFLKTT